MALRTLLVSLFALSSHTAGAWSFFSDERQDVLQLPLVSSNKTHNVDLFSLHKDLISIESVTGNEYDVGVFLVKYLKGLNLTVETQAVDPEDSASSAAKSTAGSFESSSKDSGKESAAAAEIVHDAKKHKYPPRFNVIAYPKHHKKTRALFSSHIDVVPPWYPYERDRDLIKGRGSVDDKACVAAQIAALQSLRNSKQIEDSDIGLLFVVGEESGGMGMKAVNALERSWDAVIFGEPTESKLAAGHKGIMMFTVSVKGKSAHSGYPWLGVNANEVLIHALDALLKLQPKLPSSDKMGETTMNLGLIRGGVAANVIPDHAEAKATVRIAAGTPADIKVLVLEAIQEATAGDLQGGAQVEVSFSNNRYSPVHIDCDIDGFECITVNYGTDIRNLEGDHKRYLYGPGSIQVAHSDHEALRAWELEKAVEDYKKIALAVLKK